MTPEQKQQAQQAIEGWQSVRNDDPMKPAGDVLAALLQEMIAAPEPEPEPVAYATGYYAGCLSIATVDGQVLSTGTALYAAPPHQSEYHLEMVNTPAPSVPGGHVYVYVSGLTGSGKSAVAGEIEIALRASGLDVEWVDSESEKHLTHADYTSALELYRPKVRIFEKNISRTAPPAPSVPVKPMENIALNEWLDKTEWVQKELNTFPVSSLGMHRADVMRLEIDRLRKLLSAAPTPAEPPADLDAPEFSDGCEKEGFPGGCERMGCCKQLPATANPARISSSQIEPPADMARDAARYRWLRNPTTDPALVIDKRVGPSFWDYEYRAGDELDAAIDAAIEREKLKGQS